MSETKVALAECADYAPAKVDGAVKKIFGHFGGAGKFAATGDRVLLKPNLLIAAAPESGICTHPEVVRSVAELVRDCGATPMIGDSPSFGSLRGVAHRAGYGEIIKRYNVKLLPFKTPVVPKSIPDFGPEFTIAKEALDADKIINLPKLKTHQQVVLTLAVKNMFGAVVGKRKPVWHVAASSERKFTRLLLAIYCSARPAFNLLDGVVGMEGKGPRKGPLRRFNLVAGAVDGVAMDAVVSALLGFSAREIPILKTAREVGEGETDLGKISIVGDPAEKFKITDFKRPEIGRIGFPVPQVVASYVKNLLILSREKKEG
ncbi:MAG: DUF362 domain-containing protein [bacterium]